MLHVSYKIKKKHKRHPTLQSRPLTSYLELLQVAVILGAVEEESGLALRALDEAVRGQQLLHHPSLPDADPGAISKGSVAIVVKQAWIKAHLFRQGSGRMVRCWTLGAEACSLVHFKLKSSTV